MGVWPGTQKIISTKTGQKKIKKGTVCEVSIASNSEFWADFTKQLLFVKNK